MRAELASTRWHINAHSTNSSLENYSPNPPFILKANAMTTEIIVRYFHFLGIGVWVASLAGELVLLQPEMTRREINRLFQLDRWYGLSAIVVVGMGLTMWLGIGKPTEFYSNNPLFILKVSLAGLVGIISIIPSIFFSRHRKGLPDEKIPLPSHIIRLVRVELILMAMIPLLAILAARGIR